MCTTAEDYMCVASKRFAGQRKREIERASEKKRIEKCKWSERIQCLSNENDDYDDNDNNKWMFRSVPFECDSLVACNHHIHARPHSLRSQMKTMKRNREEVYAYRTTTITRVQDIGFVSRIDAIARRLSRAVFSSSSSGECDWILNRNECEPQRGGDNRSSELTIVAWGFATEKVRAIIWSKGFGSTRQRIDWIFIGLLLSWFWLFAFIASIDFHLSFSGTNSHAPKVSRK